LAKLSFSEAFSRYGAKLRNMQWAVSAIAEDQLVVSCWQQYFGSAEDGVLPYEDRLSRWSGPGNNLLREHLEQANREELPVRLVIARADQPEAVDQGANAGTVKKTFSVREDLIGRVTEFDGDDFRIEFRRA
jgi:hypothetical protein